MLVIALLNILPLIGSSFNVLNNLLPGIQEQTQDAVTSERSEEEEEEEEAE